MDVTRAPPALERHTSTTSLEICPAPHGDSTSSEHWDKTIPRQCSIQSKNAGEPDERLVQSKAKTFVVFASLFLSLFLAALDFTIVSPALPTISNYFHSSAGYTWIGTAYLLANAASTPLWGRTSDIWGRKRVLLTAVATFFLGSLLCAAAQSVGMLITGRAVQGSAAGGIVILVNICVSDLFDIRDRSFYLGLTSLVWVIASGIGPVLGGILTVKASWRWIWWINLPCSGLAILVLLLFLRLPPSKPLVVAGIRSVDWLGSLSVLGVTVMLLLGLQFGGVSFPWNSPTVICLVIFGLGMIAVFLLCEAKVAEHPIMPLALFRRRSNVAALLVCFFHGFTYISAFYFLPLYIQAVGGASTLLSGILLLPIALAQSLTGILSGFFMRKTGRYLEIIWLGMAFLTLGFGLLIDLNAQYSVGKVVAFQLVAGFGVGLVFQSPLVALQRLVATDDIATATATFGFFRNMATALSVTLGGVVFQNTMQSQHQKLESLLGPALAAHFEGGSASANVDIVASLSASHRTAVREAYAYSLRYVWTLSTCTAALGLLVAFTIQKTVLSAKPSELNGVEMKPIEKA